MTAQSLAFIGGVGGGELLVIFVVFLLLFGAKKLPGIARSLGKSVSEFQRAAREVREEFLNADREIRDFTASKPAASSSPHDDSEASKALPADGYEDWTSGAENGDADAAGGAAPDGGGPIEPARETSPESPAPAAGPGGPSDGAEPAGPETTGTVSPPPTDTPFAERPIHAEDGDDHVEIPKT